MEEGEERHVLAAKEHITEVASVSTSILWPDLSQTATPNCERYWDAKDVVFVADTISSAKIWGFCRVPRKKGEYGCWVSAIRSLCHRH